MLFYISYLIICGGADLKDKSCVYFLALNFNSSLMVEYKHQPVSTCQFCKSNSVTGDHSNVTFCSKNIQIFTLLQVMFFPSLPGFSNQLTRWGKKQKGSKNNNEQNEK